MGKWGHIIAVLAIIIGALVALYIDSPSGFVVKIYPENEIHVCVMNGSLIFDQVVEVTPGVYEMAPGRLIISGDSVYYVENVSVTNINSPWWSFGHVVKPYKYQVTLIAQNSPPGIDVTFANPSFSAELQDTSDITGSLPLNAEIVLKINNSVVPSYGTHYITIKAKGQDGMENTCTCILKVGRSCGKVRFLEFKYGNFSQ